MMEQKFDTGDIVMTDDGFKCRVVCCGRDEDGNVWYELDPVEFAAWMTRELPQSRVMEVIA